MNAGIGIMRAHTLFELKSLDEDIFFRNKSHIVPNFAHLNGSSVCKYVSYIYMHAVFAKNNLYIPSASPAREATTVKRASIYVPMKRFN